MKAETNRFLRLTSTLLVVAASAFATGCIAQAGDGTESSTSSNEALTSDQGVVAPAERQTRQGAPATVQHENSASLFTTSTVLNGAHLERTSPTTNPNNPGSEVKAPGDGKEPNPQEPDPHPWHCSVQSVTR